MLPPDVLDIPCARPCDIEHQGRGPSAVMVRAGRLWGEKSVRMMMQMGAGGEVAGISATKASDLHH